MGFELVHNGKRMDCLLAATLPTELHMVFKPTPDF